MEGKQGKLSSVKAIARLEEIKDDIKTISTRATWMLGVLVLIILGLASFVSKDFGFEIQTNSLFWMIWVAAAILCIAYFMVLLIYIPLLIWPNFGIPIHKISGDKELQKSIELNDDILDKLIKNLKALISLFVGLPFLCLGLAASFTYLV